MDQREPDQLDGVPLPEMRSAFVGHEAAVTALWPRIAQARMPGGVLIHGPRGIGKATLAFAFARAVFEATADESPEQIAAQVAAGAYPNLFVLRRTLRDTGKGYNSVIRVDEVRHFVEQLHMTRGRAGHRIALIDAMDDANAAAANALLKILEEPPADTTFLLISHRPGALLPTIKSRCFPLALRPLEDRAVADILSATVSAPADALATAVSLAGGCPRRGFEALLLSDTGSLAALRGWLANPAAASAGDRLALADALGADRDSAELRFARDMIFDFLAAETREAALAGPPARHRLDLLTELWEKARLSLADADIYNLDMRQTLVGIFDAIRRLDQNSAVPSRP